MKKRFPVSGVKVGVKNRSVAYALPSPIKGLNNRDPISAKDPLYAESLVNMVCTPSGVKLREGFARFSTGYPAQVETVIPYNGVGIGTDRLFAACNGAIYNATAPGAVGAPVLTGLSSNQWSFVQQTGATGSANFLVIANGVDAVRHWDGTTWTTWTNVASPTAPGQISLNPAVTAIHSPITHQRRLWFVENNSTRAWYLPVASIGGTAVSFDFGTAFPRGGQLVQLASWSLDAGAGINSFLMAVSSEGDLVIYQGTDPASATDWRLTGTWRLAPPTMRRCFLQYGGDVLYMSAEGLMPLSKYMQSASNDVALSDAISETFSQLSTLQAGLSGFQIIDVPHRNLVLVNVPQIDPNQNVQFVMNTITKGWSLFVGIPARSWATLNNRSYFGGVDYVGVAFTGFRDNTSADGSGGSTFYGSAQQAFSYFDERARSKRVHTARVNLDSNSTAPSFQIGVNADFDMTPPSAIGVSAPTSTSLWGISVWGTATWSSGFSNYNEWQSVGAVGYCLAPTIIISSQAETTWVSTDLVFEMGGIIGQ